MDCQTKLTKQKLQTLAWRWRGVLISIPTVTVIVLGLRMIGLLQFWEWAAFDFYTRYQPKIAPDQRIAIVGINENDLREIGQALIPDQIYAELLQKLSQMEPRAIGLLVYRDLPVPPGYPELLKTFQNTPNLVGIEKAVGTRQQGAVNPPPLLDALQQVGASDLMIDSDYRVRRGLVYLKNYQGETVYGFGFRLALQYLAADGITPKVIPETSDWYLGKQKFFPLEPNDGGYVRMDASGYQILLNYQGPSGFFETVSLMDVLNNGLPPNWGENRIILIGQVGESFSDFFPTPYSIHRFKFPEQMAGVEIQAHLTSQIIRAAKGEHPLIQTGSEFEEVLYILISAGLGSTLAWVERYRQHKLTALVQIIALTGVTSLLIGMSYFAFLEGWWIPIIAPVIALWGSALVITGYMAHKAILIRATFGRYLTDDVVAQLLESQDGLQFGGHQQQLTIVTSDLKKFTALSEQLQPEEVVKVINLYFRQMSKVVVRHGGTINKFLGDGMLILFSSSLPKNHHACAGIACAIAMQLEMKTVNMMLNELGFPSLEMGIGINTGEVIIGHIGSKEHTEYTAIGGEVNLAFRIEAATIGNQILISEATKAAAESTRLELHRTKEIQVAGFIQPKKVYELLGVGAPYHLYLYAKPETLLPLDIELPIQYIVLQDQQDSRFFHNARLVKLSQNEAEIKVSSDAMHCLPSPQTNIKLHLQPVNQRKGEEAYAKVLRCSILESVLHIRFTFQPPTVAAQLTAIYESLQVLDSA